MTDNDSRPREVIPSFSSQTKRSPKLEFTIVNDDIHEANDRHRHNDLPFQPSGSAVDNFSPMMIPIDPMMASPEMSYHMTGYQGMPPGYPQQNRPFQLPMDYAGPGYNSYVGMALEEQHRMAGLGAAPFPGNPLMYLSGTYPQMAAQQYSMYAGRPQHNKPAPPPPPSSHILGRRPQNNVVERPKEEPRQYDHSAQKHETNRPYSYLDRRIDVPDRTKIRPVERPRDQDSSGFRYHSHEAARLSDHYHEHESFDRNPAHNYRDRGQQIRAEPRNLPDDRNDMQAETKMRPRPVEDIYRDYARPLNRRDPRQRSVSPAAKNPRFDQRSFSPPARNQRFDQRPHELPRRTDEPPRRPDDHRNDPRFDRRNRDKSTDIYQSRYDYGRHNGRNDQNHRAEAGYERNYRHLRTETGNERRDRDLRNERNALTGRSSSRDNAATSRNDASASSTDKVVVNQSLHSRGLNVLPPESTAPSERVSYVNSVPNVNKPLVTLIASHSAHDDVKISSPEEGEISIKAQLAQRKAAELAQRKAAELAKPIDPRRLSAEKIPEIASKSESKDSMTSKTESDPTRMLFCRNIPKAWSEAKLQELFGGFGDIIEMNLTHLQSRGIVFIRFYDIRSAIGARNKLDGQSPQEYGSDASLSVHFSKSEEEKNPDIACTLEHYQGALLVRLTKKEHTHSMVRKLEAIFSNYGAIKCKRDASLIGKQGLLVEFYDARHCAAAFYGLNRTKLGSLIIRLSLEWDIPDSEPVIEKEAPQVSAAHQVSKAPQVHTAPPSGFFIDVHGDDRKRRLSSGPVDLAEIIRKDTTKPDKDAVFMEILESFPPNSLSNEQESNQVGAETSTPILLQQMSSLLSSLQKNQTEPPQKKATKAEPQKSKPPQKSSLNEPDVFKSLKPDQPASAKPYEVSVKGGESAVLSSGGVVSADRMKKAPTLESVQQLAKLLLQQTRDT